MKPDLKSHLSKQDQEVMKTAMISWDICNPRHRQKNKEVTETEAKDDAMG